MPRTPDDQVPLGLPRDRIALGGVRLTVAATTLQTALYVLNSVTFELEALDADRDRTPFAWLAASVMLAAAAACVLLAVRVRRPWLLLPLGGMIAFLSLDEAIGVHERVGARAATVLGVAPDWGRAAWPVLYLPLMLAIVVLAIVAVRKAPRAGSQLVHLGLGCLGAAVVAEIGSTFLTDSGGSIVYGVEVALEEGLELAGWCLIAAGLASWLGAPRRARLRLASPA